MVPMPVPSFLRRAPVALAFGTSGLRGLVTDITDLEAYINVKGALRYLAAIGDAPASGPVILGGDLRPSTARILVACARAVRDVGGTVVHAGRLPTPALMLACLARRCAGVMVTGSHIPFDRNGIKVNRAVGEVLKSDEPGILREVAAVRAEEYARSAEESAFDADGMRKADETLAPVDAAIARAYLDRYVSAMPGAPLRGLRVLFHQHSSVGRELVPEILRELGAEVVTAGRSETFVAIDTESIGDDQVAELTALCVVAEAAHGAMDAVVSTDGDSDRPLMLAVRRGVDGAPSLRFLPGDLLGLVVAERLGADAVAVPVSTNDAVAMRLAELGVRLRTTRIGSPWVVAALAALVSEGAQRVMGWEANGGFLLGSAVSLGAAVLEPLPTRDAVLPLAVNLLVAAERRCSLDAVWAALPQRFGRAGLVDGVAPAITQAVMARLVPAGAATEVRFAADGSVSDAARAHDWHTSRSVMARFFTEADGFGTVLRVNALDGVRMTFDGGDVAHVRASGNAPQLRIYANAATQSRADAIVAAGLRPVDGILARMAAELGG